MQFQFSKFLATYILSHLANYYGYYYHYYLYISAIYYLFILRNKKEYMHTYLGEIMYKYFTYLVNNMGKM